MASDHGAYDYLPKPFDIDKLAETVRRALQKKPNAWTGDSQAAARRSDETLPLIGRSKSMQSVYRVIARVMNNDLTVLIEGESGTGKDLAARAIHQLGKRKSGPFVAVSLAALQRDQVEEELFGAGRDDNRPAARKGSRSRWRHAVPGRSRRHAARSADAPCSLPAGRSLCDRLGDDLDVRIIASTKHDLRSLVDQGLFREDLYYRLNVVALQLPPLRERKEDIPDLASAFLVRAKKEGLPEKQLDKSAYDLLVAYDWPGNVRELENVIRRLSALSPEPVISAREVERELRSTRARWPGEREFEAEIEALLSRHFISALSADPDKDPDGGPDLPDRDRAGGAPAYQAGTGRDQRKQGACGGAVGAEPEHAPLQNQRARVSATETRLWGD